MALSFADHSVLADGNPVLVGLADEIAAEPDELGCGLFLRVAAKASNSRLRFGLGSIAGLWRYTVCHRYEPYWMKPRAGTKLSEVPPETQYLLAELEDERWLLLVPLVDEPFRFSLRGKQDNTLEILAETGDSFTPGLGGRALFVAIGQDPFELMHAAARSVAARLGSGRLRKDKPLPDFARVFGWCTWDAFYQEVTAAKVREGLESFARGGVSPRMLILDDGWQSIDRLATGEKRLTAFAPNEKFPEGLSHTVRMAKDDFGIQTFLVWHTLNGYWGGVDGARLSGYGVIDQVRRFGEGILAHEPTFNEDWWGSLVGFIPAEQIARFYDDYHRSLAAQGVDGVKVDSQATLEGLCERQGSRVRVSRAYRQALEGSVRRHFDGRLINCMSNAQETWYGSPDSTLLRTSVDFYPTRPELHGLHLYTNAQVGVWFGEFMHPDWDMFQSGHEWGAFHAAGRAVSGGPVYASDKPGAHSFELLKKLVCSDGSALLCDAPGLPTQDCLCHDPTRESILLKLWNRNRDAAIVGVFHCQYSPDSNQQRTLEGTVSPSDVPGFTGSKFASYAHQARTLDVLDKSARQPISLTQGGYELFSFVPVEHGFAAIGLADKMNSAGALSRVGWQGESHVELEVRDGGEFLAYSARPPVKVEVDGQAVAFEHDAETGSLSLKLVKNGKQTLSVRF